jgi:hypothetical protein
VQRIAAADRRSGRGATLIDGGVIRGGFAFNYPAHIMPQQTGPFARAIAVSTGTDRFPKFDVEVQSDENKPWRCSFEGTERGSVLFSTPNPSIAGLVTDRTFTLFLINAREHGIEELRMSTPAASAVSDFEGGKLFLATAIDVKRRV